MVALAGTAVGWVAAVMGAVGLAAGRADEPRQPQPLVMVVMDPLAAPLSCPCVKGYAQRDYGKLRDFLAERLGRPVVVRYGESLAQAVAKTADRAGDIVVGKRSVVVADAARAGQQLVPIADLTGKDGSTGQRGLIVVRDADPARTVADLRGYRIILGPADAVEKHAAARDLLAAPISEACSDGATEVVEAAAEARIAAVISSYARPLLEGCGTIEKGDLRVVGETGDVPFITAFVAERLDATLRGRIRDALLEVRSQPLLRLELESKSGFVPPAPAPSPNDNGAWPGWRGPARDAQVPRLPARLPARFEPAWKKTLFQQGLGGPAVAHGLAVVGDRDTADEADVFHAVDAINGERRWAVRYPAPGRLDYGNSPRATPLITADAVYLLGAFGHLHCVRRDTGRIIWKKHLREEFGVADELVWGVCSSPLIVDGKLIVNPGGRVASLVALDPATGAVIWKAAGGPAAFASFVVHPRAGGSELVGFDKLTCGGWDVATGQRRWTFAPRTPGDFNVPTPLVLDERILLMTENNGSRLVGFDAAGRPELVAAYQACAPDMHTPVRVGDRVFAVSKNKIHCLSAADLRVLWTAADRCLAGHVSLIASADRLLAQTQAGELLLIDARADRLSILSRLAMFAADESSYAHPALVGDRLYVRGPGHLFCLSLTGEDP
jgi:outer membrane protein assembly factor BamB/ABC-type phosphate/phosphonate transport system substrate-binding protein